MSEALAGSSRNTVFIKGTYESQGEITTLRLQAVKGVLTGEVLAQVCVEYKAKKRRSNVLVAVLDIESTALTGSMKKAFSDLFRSALGRLGGFSLASSADVDKMNPDAIQQATGCTRDECATIIGEQLGVDRVISSSLFELTQNKFMITGKIMDILDGSILQISTVRYEGQIENIDPALEELASKLSGQNNPSELPVVSTKIEQLPKVQTANDDDHSWWKTKLTFSLIACLTTGLYAYSENQEALTQREDLEENESMMTNTNSNIEASNYNDLANKNREAIKTHNQNMQTGLMLSSLLAV
ncbi:MAG: hypothetical protein GY786_10660 [Proteobacteria bacterium]|nr:hypothetical protein [Pseudomonadota bacterium]